MDITLIRILLFGFPGIVGFILYSSINGISESKKDWEKLLIIFVFSVLSYTILDIVCSLVPLDILKFLGLMNCSFNEMLLHLKSGSTIVFNFKPMIFLSLISFLLVYLSTYIVNKKVFNRLANWMNLTKKVSNDDIWSIFHDTYEEWVIIRDFKNQLIYYGYIDSFSDTSIKHELLMVDVDVYNEKSEFMYKTDVLYLSREHDAINIEIHDYSKNKEEEVEDE